MLHKVGLRANEEPLTSVDAGAIIITLLFSIKLTNRTRHSGPPRKPLCTESLLSREIYSSTTRLLFVLGSNWD